MYIDLVYRFVSVEKDKNKQSTLSKENHSSVRNTIENDLRIQSDYYEKYKHIPLT